MLLFDQVQFGARGGCKRPGGTPWHAANVFARALVPCGLFYTHVKNLHVPSNKTQQCSRRLHCCIETVFRSLRSNFPLLTEQWWTGTRRKKAHMQWFVPNETLEQKSNCAKPILSVPNRDRGSHLHRNGMVNRSMRIF